MKNRIILYIYVVSMLLAAGVDTSTMFKSPRLLVSSGMINPSCMKYKNWAQWQAMKNAIELDRLRDRIADGKFAEQDARIQKLETKYLIKASRDSDLKPLCTNQVLKLDQAAQERTSYAQSCKVNWLLIKEWSKNYKIWGLGVGGLTAYGLHKLSLYGQEDVIIMTVQDNVFRHIKRDESRS